MGRIVGNLTRRGILGGLLAGVAMPLWAEGPANSLRPKRRPERPADKGVADLVTAAKLGAGVVAFAVADAGTGRLLESTNATMPLPPASVCKAVTALYALEKLGPSHRFTTRVLRTGAINDGRLDGDLILAGGGDPTFDTDKMGDLVASLAARGVRRVTGRFLAYAGALPEMDRIAADQPDHVGYNPAISGLMLNFNRVNFEWKRANGKWSLAMDARGERFVPPVKMAKMRVAARDLPIFAYETSPPAEDHWSVAETALGDDGSRWLPVRHPAPYVAEVFQTLCAAQGIVLPAAQIITTLPAAAEVIVQHQSDPLPDLLRGMLKFSTNLTAEAVGLTASGAATLSGSAAAMTAWAQASFGITGVFGDHSGLGPASRITAADMMTVMIRARGTSTGPMLHGLLRQMGLAGPDGREQNDSAIRSHAKSGTLNFVSCLAGYVTKAPDKELAFAIFTADLPRRDALPMAQREDPEGGAGWTKRARRLQGQLIARWAGLYL
jgi:D-alanyl-D-alanine carboxypeptidase/D-alanyl-D-alanine-endopeptidase (penicillin-binding protein 4)